MPDYTPNLNLYLPGGGGSGTIPDEIADIDKLNENFRTIDASLGGTIVPAVAGYTPDFDGNIVYARNERRLLMESAVDGGLLNISPGANMHIGTAAERAAFTAFAADGVLWRDTDAGKYEYMKRGAIWIGGAATLTMGAGYTEVGGSTNVVRSGDFVHGTIRTTRTTTQTANGEPWFTLPEGFRPDGQVEFVMLTSGGTGGLAPHMLQIGANGIARVWYVNVPTAGTATTQSSAFMFRVPLT